jgi:hypothetical protein
MAHAPEKMERREDWYKVHVKIQNTIIAERIDVDIDFDALRLQLAYIENEHGDTYSKFRIEVTTESEYYGNESTHYYVYGWRHETDEEFGARCAERANHAARVLAQERKEYNRLANKFS